MPGAMAMLVAPVVTQLSVLLVPELMLVGFALKDVIAGAEPFPEGGPEELAKPQPASAAKRKTDRTSA